jgi:hypothetical protein
MGTTKSEPGLSLNLRRVFVSHFHPSVLRELASLMEAESPGMVARARLSDASLDEFAEMVAAGRKPTIGWWTRHTTVPADTGVSD